MGAIPPTGGNMGRMSIVNALATDTGFEALVIARPEDLTTVEILPPAQGLTRRHWPQLAFNIGFITPIESHNKTE